MPRETRKEICARKTEILELTEIEPGASIEEVATEAYEAQDLCGAPVWFVFNGLRFITSKEGTPDQMVRAYEVMGLGMYDGWRRSACSFIRSASDFEHTKQAIRDAGYMTLQDMEVMPDPVLFCLAIRLGWNKKPAEPTSAEVH